MTAAPSSRLWRRHCVLCVALAVAALAPLALSASLGPRYGGHLRVGVLDLAAGGDPAFSYGPGTRLLRGLVHQPLVTLRPDGTLRSGLATRWVGIASNREWAIELDPAATFHDGQRVTAEDVVRSLRRFLRSASPSARLLADALEGGPSFRARSSEDLPGLVVPEPGRVSLRLVRSGQELPASLAAPSAAVISPTGAACGPFVLTHAVRDESALLLPFAGHVHGRPFLDRLELRRLSDRSALRTALERGEIDVALGESGPATRDGRLLLLLDPARPLLQRPESRLRIAAALDREVLSRRFLPESSPLCRLLSRASDAAPCAPAAFRPAAAAGPGPGPQPSFTLAVEQGIAPSASQRVAAHILALGYDVKVAVGAPGTLSTAAADGRLVLWTPELDEPLHTLAELISLSGAEGLLSELVSVAALDTASARREAALARLERALLDSAAVVPLAATPTLAVGHRRVVGTQSGPTGRPTLEDTWLSR
jgi:MarR-like DNA-binding transcriptional regulator SgrR of sgrS sRNA